MGAVIHELWQDISKLHYIYFITNEAIPKLEIRKELEDCLEKFLSIVQNDRKFFLPQTGEVLKKTIQEMDYFSAQNAINAFDAISQYANHLFSKPWRKEFRILKMSSGYYQHTIKSNLLDADRLFEAMGYRRLLEDTFLLDGSICPEQVLYVSLDAMTACMELQIIKHIYTILDTNGINVSWLDILRYREKYSGGILQAIKALTHEIEEKRYSREIPLTNYNINVDLQSSLNTSICFEQCQCHNYLQFPSLTKRHSQRQSSEISWIAALFSEFFKKYC